MVRLLLVIFLGITSGFILALICWAVLSLLRPLLDPLRAVLHSPTPRRNPSLTAFSVRPAVRLPVSVAPSEMMASENPVLNQQAFQLFLQDSMSEHWKSFVQVRNTASAPVMIDLYRNALEESLSKWSFPISTWNRAYKWERSLQNPHLIALVQKPANFRELSRYKIMLTFSERHGKSQIRYIESKKSGTSIEMQKRALEKLLRHAQAPVIETSHEDIASQTPKTLQPMPLNPAWR